MAMMLSEQITNQLRIQGLNKPLKIPSATLSKWRDEVAQLEAENARLREERNIFRLALSLAFRLEPQLESHSEFSHLVLEGGDDAE